jgi:hypothetical protein
VCHNCIPDKLKRYTDAARAAKPICHRLGYGSLGDQANEKDIYYSLTCCMHAFLRTDGCTYGLPASGDNNPETLERRYAAQPKSTPQLALAWNSPAKHFQPILTELCHMGAIWQSTTGCFTAYACYTSKWWCPCNAAHSTGLQPLTFCEGDSSSRAAITRQMKVTVYNQR